MAKVFDAALKQLVDAFAADWLAWLGPRLGLPPGTVYEPLDADLSTVSPQADKLFRVSGPTAGVVHLELQTSWDERLAGRLLVYNVLAEYRHGGPVQTVLMLLRRDANSPALIGNLRRTGTDGRVYLEFGYTVIRAWELHAAELLAGPLGTLPLATITDDARLMLPDVVNRLNDRILRDGSDRQAQETLRATAYILMGLRYDDDTINRLFQGLKTMEESTTYQYILRRGKTEGRVEAEQRVVRLLGEQRFGAPPVAADAALEAITDPDRLERITARLLQASGWDDLLATP